MAFLSSDYKEIIQILNLTSLLRNFVLGKHKSHTKYFNIWRIALCLLFDVNYDL